MKKVYPTLKTAETPQSSVIPVSIDASALPKDPDGNIVSKYRDVPDAIGSYYTDLLSKPEFQRRVGGVEKARELAKKLNSIKLYRGNSWLGEGGFSNPITGNITLYSPYFRPDIGIHETGHQMMDASPEYAKRVYDVADRHGINYSPVYLPIPSDYFYRRHPYELGAELQSLRFRTNLMPGTGTGAGGRITPKDVNSKRWMFDDSPYFNDIDDDTISDFLNNAKSSKPAVHGRPLSPYTKTAEDNTMTEAYLAGFRKTAEEHGINPDLLLKQAFWPALAGLAALGTGAYGLYKTYKDFKTWTPTRGTNIQKSRTDLKGVPGLGSVQAYGNALRQRSENVWKQVHE